MEEEALQALQEATKTVENAKQASEKLNAEVSEKVTKLEDAMKQIQEGSIDKETIENLQKDVNEALLAAKKKSTEGEEIKSVEDIMGKDFLAEVAKKKTNGFDSFEVKAATSMTIGAYPVTQSDLNGILLAQREGGIFVKPKMPPRVAQFVDWASTSAAVIWWIEKVNEQGNAAFIGEGKLKPLRSYQIQRKTADSKKIAVAYRTSTEALEDIPGFLGDLKTDGFDEVGNQTNEKLLNGDGTGDNPKGVIPHASAYALTDIKGLTPDNMGAIRATIAQISALGFTPNAVFVNPIDAANMDLTKGSDGHYVIPPFQSGTGLSIAGVPVIETNEVAAGKFLAGDFKKYHVRAKGGIKVDVGLDGNDFRENMRTVIVEQRLFAYVRSVDTGAFVHDSFATVKAAITQA